MDVFINVDGLKYEYKIDTRIPGLAVFVDGKEVKVEIVTPINDKIQKEARRYIEIMTNKLWDDFIKLPKGFERPGYHTKKIFKMGECHPEFLYGEKFDGNR